MMLLPLAAYLNSAALSAPLSGVCSDLLVGGVFNERLIKGSSEAVGVANSVVCSTATGGASDTSSFGVDARVPIEGVPVGIGMDTADDKFAHWHNTYCNAQNSSLDISQIIDASIRVADPGLVAMFRECRRDELSFAAQIEEVRRRARGDELDATARVEIQRLKEETKRQGIAAAFQERLALIKYVMARGVSCICTSSLTDTATFHIGFRPLYKSHEWAKFTAPPFVTGGSRCTPDVGPGEEVPAELHITCLRATPTAVVTMDVNSTTGGACSESCAPPIPDRIEATTEAVVNKHAGPRTADSLCREGGFARALDARGYYWFQCAGPGVCPSGWSGSSKLDCPLPAWEAGRDCIGSPYGTGAGFQLQAGGGGTVYNPCPGGTDDHNCRNNNPGWRVRLRCEKP